MILGITMLLVAFVVTMFSVSTESSPKCWLTLLIFGFSSIGASLIGRDAFEEQKSKVQNPKVQEIKVTYKNGVPVDSIVVYK